MAQRRMFNKSIVNSSKFLKMPVSSRLLYYDLGMNADDDGFCEHFMVMKMTGASEQDLSVLEVNGFVRVFDENVLIIMDWKENNFIRMDRYNPSKYVEIYSLEKIGIPDGNQMATNGIPTVATGKVRLGKVRLGKDSLGEDSTVKEKTAPKKARFTPPTVEQVTEYCRERNNTVDAERFVDFYASKGWLVGKAAMKDWKAAVRNWEKGSGLTSDEQKHKTSRVYNDDLAVLFGGG